MANKTTIDKYIDEIKNLTGLTPTVTGGGRGWTASIEPTTISGDEPAEVVAPISNKGDSKEHALGGLLVALARREGFDPDDMTEAEAAKCVAECMGSIRPYCECRCGGRNHGRAPGGFLSLGQTLVLLGEKPCACGCGGLTARRFRPGHDARFHAAEKRQKAADAAGLSLLEYAAAQAKAKTAAAKTRREAKKAAQASIDDAVVERIAAAAG